MSLTDELDLCYDGDILSNKEKLLKISKFLWVEEKFAMRYQIMVVVWRIWGRKEEKLCDPSRSSKYFEIKISYHICLENPTLHE